MGRKSVTPCSGLDESEGGWDDGDLSEMSRFKVCFGSKRE